MIIYCDLQLYKNTSVFATKIVIISDFTINRSKAAIPK